MEILKYNDCMGFLIELDPTRDEQYQEGSSRSKNHFLIAI